MKILQRSIFARILFLLAPLAALFVSSPLNFAQKTKDETSTVMRVHQV